MGAILQEYFSYYGMQNTMECFHLEQRQRRGVRHLVEGVVVLNCQTKARLG